MAQKEDKNLNNSEKLRSKSSLLVYGTDTTLDDEDSLLKNIVQRTVIETKNKLGERTNGKPINYFNEINFGKAFNNIFISDDNKKQKDEKSGNNFKRMMSEYTGVNAASLLMEENERSILYNNYRIIHKHIPECANALNIYKDNIMSPDDYTKLIFNITYDKAIDESAKKVINNNIDDLTEKYQIEEKADEIIEEALLLGNSYYAVLSLDDELNYMLDDPIYNNGVLNEDLYGKLSKILSEESTSYDLNDSDVDATTEEKTALMECLNLNITEGDKNSSITENSIIKNIINNNVKIGSKKEFLRERLELLEEQEEKNKENKLNDIPDDYLKNDKNSKAKRDNIKMNLNGSVIRHLIPERVVELKIDDICYGYYYAEDAGNVYANSTYLGSSIERDSPNSASMDPNGTMTGNSLEYKPMGAAGQLEVSEQKLRLISDMFLKNISKKIDKKFVKNNKQFKDFIYDLVRQDYIIKKGLTLTYFKPDEVIKFEVQPVYRDITFFAKLYLSILTNNLLIKLGRSHDKRIFYVNTGLDAKYEEAINTVIQDVKTKDYRMENLNDFNTILNLSPGRFDDYFMPTFNGDRPIEIDTLAGMDVDMNNDFVEYLKNSMMSGMSVPRNLIDVTSDVDYARSISAMNANFVRSVIRYQKKLTPAFTTLYQRLYRNEYKYFNDNDSNEQNVDISEIRVKFPSPASLSMSNLIEQLQSADQNADYIASQIYPTRMDQRDENKKTILKTMIVKDLVPSVDWSKYEEMKENVEKMVSKDEIENPAPEDNNQNSYGGGYY